MSKFGEKLPIVFYKYTILSKNGPNMEDCVQEGVLILKNGIFPHCLYLLYQKALLIFFFLATLQAAAVWQEMYPCLRHILQPMEILIRLKLAIQFNYCVK